MMFNLRNTLALGLLLCTSTLSGCLFLGDDEPGDVPCRAPVCGEGEVESGRCGPDELCDDECMPDTSCRAETACGETVFCEQDTVNCLASPVCPEGRVEVEECNPWSMFCSTETLCGKTIQCERRDVIDCDAVLTCPAGGQQVASCQPDAAVECQDVTLCDQTITCQFPLGCAPQNVRGRGSCAFIMGYAWDGASCNSLTGCECVGSDCEEAYANYEECQTARSSCAL
jgi:hypothetical protein